MNTSGEDWDEIRFLVELFQKLFIHVLRKNRPLMCVLVSRYPLSWNMKDL
jgi:hypothetical protein